MESNPRRVHRAQATGAKKSALSLPFLQVLGSIFRHVEGEPLVMMKRRPLAVGKR